MGLMTSLTAAWMVLAAAASHTYAADVHQWKAIPRESGPDNYYKVVDTPDGSFIRAEYRPPFESAVWGFEIPSSLQRVPVRLVWQWRAWVLPRGGNECVAGKGDSAAGLYVVWKDGLHWYSLKYVWSPEATAGTVCNRHNGLFKNTATVVLRSASAPLGQWLPESVDLNADFRKYFGDDSTDIPWLQGLGILTDGDQTHSVSKADYGSFVLAY
jgi:hypothetical protein